MRAAIHTRACLSIAKLCALAWLVQIASSPQYGDGCAGGVLASLGVFGSRTSSLICVAVVALRIDDGHVVGAGFERAVDRPVRVHRRIAFVARDLVVQIDLRIGPVPHRDDDVALAALRPRRRDGRQLAPRNPIGPVGPHRQRTRAADLREASAHAAAGLAGLDAAIPRGAWSVERAEVLGDLARRLVAHLMAAGAAVGVDDVANPFALALACSARCRCRSDRCRGSHSWAATAAARTSTAPGSTRPRLAGWAQARPSRCSCLPGVGFDLR